MKLIGGRVALGPETTSFINLTLKRGKILPFDTTVACRTKVDLTGHLVLPGMINAHDHLEFNLFPRLGGGAYANASAWARDIYHPSRSPIKEHLSVSKDIRLHWGGLKNLISGVTTVMHHNPFESGVFDAHFPVRVVRRFGWAHSLDFSPDIARRFRRTPPNRPFIVHAAEGTDAAARCEISRLERMGLLDSRTVLVHAVALDDESTQKILWRGCCLIWCPSSNLFTLGQTLGRELSKLVQSVALGSDSALTARGDLLDEICFASQTEGLTKEQIYRFVTSQAARVLKLDQGEGEISPGGVADLVAVKDQGRNPADQVARLKPELVMVGGRIKLVSHEMVDRLPQSAVRGFQRVCVEERGRWLVDADIRSLTDAASKALGASFRLAGRRVIS